MNRFEQFSLLIFEIEKYWHKITTQEMKKFDLRGPHTLYLLALHSHPDGLSAPKLCEICEKNKADVSRTMAIFLEKGMVVKKGDHQNQYGGIYTLTSQGQYLADQIRDRANIAVKLAGKDLDEKHRIILYSGLKGIAENLKEISNTSMLDDYREEI